MTLKTKIVAPNNCPKCSGLETSLVGRPDSWIHFDITSKAQLRSRWGRRLLTCKSILDLKFLAYLRQRPCHAYFGISIQTRNSCWTLKLIEWDYQIRFSWCVVLSAASPCYIVGLIHVIWHSSILTCFFNELFEDSASKIMYSMFLFVQRKVLAFPHYVWYSQWNNVLNDLFIGLGIIDAHSLRQ